MKHFRSLLFLPIFLLLTACIEENTFNDGRYVRNFTPDIHLNVSSLNFNSMGGQLEIQITCNTNWTVSCSESWLSVSPASGTGNGTLIVEATENTSFESRVCTLYIICGDDIVTRPVNVTQKEMVNTGNYAYVNLGLPSGLLWAAMNLGASSPEEYGDYYAWGETQTKKEFTWNNYKWCNGSSSSLIKYNTNSAYGTTDKQSVLELSDDVANETWGSPWQMPSTENWTELTNPENCTWTWTTVNEVDGYEVISKVNGHTIFLPAAGFRSEVGLNYKGRFGYYWSTSLDESKPSSAWSVRFSSSKVGQYGGDRYSGRSIRPVCRP